MIILLLRGQRAVVADLIAVDPVRLSVGHVQQRLVGRERDAVGILQPGVHHLDCSVGTDGHHLGGLSRIAVRDGDVDPPVVAHGQVVAADSVGDLGRLAIVSVGDDPVGLNSVQASVGAERLAVGPLRVLDKSRNPAVETNFISGFIRDVIEEDLALRVGGGPFGKLVAHADELPVFARNEDFSQWLRPLAGRNGLGPVLPEPARGVGENLGRVLTVVAAVAPIVVDLVAGEAQGAFQFLIGHPPVAAVDVEVVRAVLEEDADRLRLIFSNQGGIDVRPA